VAISTRTSSISISRLQIFRRCFLVKKADKDSSTCHVIRERDEQIPAARYAGSCRSVTFFEFSELFVRMVVNAEYEVFLFKKPKFGSLFFVV
jgi:hypothetical protein